MTEAQPRLEVVWAQSEEDISMTTTLGVGDGEAEDVQVLFTDQDMTITLGGQLCIQTFLKPGLHIHIM